MYALQVTIVALVAGQLTWFVNHRLQKGPVLASALVCLVAGLVLPSMFSQGYILAAVAACASYVGMSAQARLKGPVDTAVALLIAALLFSVTESVYVGVGGRLGTIAAISAMTVWTWGQVAPVRQAWGQMARIYSRLL